MPIPKNVIQTGVSDPCHKIYMEDYVHTLLTQYRENEADFCLYGKREQEGEITYYFIYGAAKEEPGWELMESRYFALQQRIGEITFDEKEAWAFFADGYSAPLEGYFIFYEQNEDMQSYLIAMHQNQPGEKTVEVRPRAAGKKVEQPAGQMTGWAAGQASVEAASPGAGENRRPSSGILPEPRRIRRRPAVYDLKKESVNDGKQENARQERPEEEKVLHAAQTGRRGVEKSRTSEKYRASERGRTSERIRAAERAASGRRKAFPVKVAALAVLLGLCAYAVTSVNGYQDVEKAGNFFAQAMAEMKGDNTEQQAPSEAPGDGGLVVEETRFAAQTESAGAEAAGAEVSGEESAGEEAAVPEDSLQEETLPVISSAVSQTEGNAAEEAPSLQPSAEPLPSQPTDETLSSQPSDEALPPESAEADAQADTKTVSYTVQRGDSLAAICRRQYGNADRVNEIAALNQISDPNHLIPGQKILLPE